MAITASEIHSLEEINYKSKLKIILFAILAFFLFVSAFLNFYPIGDKLKALVKTQFKNVPGCNPDFDQIRMEWFMPKIVISDLVLPASCFNRTGEPYKFSYITLNYHLINFSPLGLPFRLDTEFSGQPLSIYFVQGIGQQMIRLKDQTLVLSRLQSVLGNDFKIAGSITVDLSLLTENHLIKNLNLKAASKDFQIPSQSIQGFTTPNLKLNELYLEANSAAHPRVNIDKLIIGDPDAPMRANFKGRINLQEGNISFSPVELSGEVAFSENFRQSLPLIDMMFQSFPQKDGFYQIRLGGTLGSLKPSAP
jgi:hypothetical protein